jgi:type IV secretory pathway TrbD component
METNLPEYRVVFRAVYRPMTVWGVERRLFFLSLMIGACTFHLFHSFLGGLLVWGALYGGAFQLTRRDPQMISILLRSGRHRPRYDAAKTSCFYLEVR